HVPRRDEQNRPDQEHREADQAPSEVDAELVGREAAGCQDDDAEAAPTAPRVIRARGEELARYRVVEDPALRLLQGRMEGPLQLRDLHLLPAPKESVEQRLLVRKH